MDRETDVFRFDDVLVDLTSERISKAGRPVVLEPKAFRVLVHFLNNPERVIAKAELLSTIWPNTFVTENALTREIAQLRKALGDNKASAKYIETVPTRGYRFIAHVGRGVPAGPPLDSRKTYGPSENAATKSRPRRAGAMIFSVLALGTALGFMTHKWMSRHSAFSLQRLEVTKLTDSGNVGLVAISPDGRYVVYAQANAEKQGLWVRQVATRSDVKILPDDKVHFPGLTFSPDSNYVYFVRSDVDAPGYHYLYKIPVLGGPASKVISNIDSAVTFSPDGREFAFTRGMSNRGVLELWIANSDGSGERLLKSFNNVIVVYQDGAAWSPDGRTIALTVRDQKNRWALDVVQVRDGSVRELFSQPIGGVGRPVWLPDGGTLIVPLGNRDLNRVQLWAISYPAGKAQHFTNDLTNYDFFIDLTRDGNTLATLDSAVASNIWVAPFTDSSKVRELTTGGPALIEAIDPGGQLIALSDHGGLWSIGPDGNRHALFAEVENVGWITSCGQFIVFNSVQPGGVDLYRAKLNGSNITKLISTDAWMAPSCSPDGKSIFFVRQGPPKTIWRMPIEGGTATYVGHTFGEGNDSLLSVSPDNNFLAYAYEEHEPEPATKLAVISVEGGPPVKVLPAPGGRFGLNWAPDGKGLQYLVTNDGVTNLWEQPLDGGEAKQLTKFTSGLICDFNWSINHKQLLLARGEARSDVILISNFRQ